MDKKRIPHPNTEKRVLTRMGATEFPDYPAMLMRDFTTYNADYPNFKKAGDAENEQLKTDIQNLENELNKNRPSDDRIALFLSRHLRIEADYFVDMTAYPEKITAALKRTRESLSDHNQNQDTLWQDPSNGAFGEGFTLFSQQCDAMIAAVNTMEEATPQIAPKYPFDFLEPISTGDKLVAYLTPLRQSNIAATGMNNRDDIGAITGAIMQLVYKPDLKKYAAQYIKGFTVDEDYVEKCTKFLDEWQDPDTGFWGEWFESDGKLYKSPDLSLTYHTVKYRQGNIKLWDKLIDTLLAIKDQPYPYGWSVDGHMNNHNSMDVVKLMGLGWDKMTEAQQDRCRADIEEMLDWCLNDSLTPDGEFIYFKDFYNSPGAAFYYGVAFLNAVGYINPKKRFWTDQDFPEAKEICLKIHKKLLELGYKDRSATAALEILNARCPCSQ